MPLAATLCALPADPPRGWPGTDAVIHDLSCDGCVVIADRPLAIGMRLLLDIAPIGPIAARIVRRHGREAGCTFAAPLCADAVFAALDHDAPARVTLAPPRLIAA